MSFAVQFLKSKKLTSIETALFWSILYLGTGTILWTSLDYFLPNTMHSFLFERIELTMQDWWRYTLYAHVIGGLACLISSLFQYSKLLLKRAPRMHKSLGYIYTLCIITLIFPTGLALSFEPKAFLKIKYLTASNKVLIQQNDEWVERNKHKYLSLLPITLNTK
ncbi:MAG: hypothetical protein ACJAR1_000843 [Rubritalea sp.]|jgi:hypothetical protein